VCVKFIKLSSQPLNKTWEKHFVDDTDYDVLYDEDVYVEKPNGQPLMCLLKGALDPAKISSAWSVLKKWNPVTENRSTASGIESEQRVKKDGTLSSTTRVPRGWEVISGIVGYFERTVRMPYCHECAWNLKHPEKFAKTLPLFQQVSQLFEQHVPNRFEIQKQFAEKTSKDFMIPGTVFTTVTLNKNFRTACHLDAGDLEAGFSAMSVLKEGILKGGNLVLPNWKTGVKLDHGDVIFFDAHEWHGNTQIVPISKGAVRCSMVHYYREKMLGCKSHEEELEIVKNRKPGDPLFPETK
jgi:hypothetical protein